MGLVEPLVAIVISFGFLGVLLYRRVNLGITLNATALLLALLGLDIERIPTVVSETIVDLLVVSVVVATFGIMLLSQLYKETGYINKLSESLSRIVKNPKIVISVLPAVLGFLPVAGGALMSAPLVDSEAEKLGLKNDKKAYANLWFRHTIFPVYPLSQVLIVAAGLTGITVSSIIVRQIPVVAVMVVVGYVFGFRKTSRAEKEQKTDPPSRLDSDLKSFLVSFSPILATIVVAVGIGLAGFGLSKYGFDVLIATFVGIAILLVISRPSLGTFAKPFRSWGIYGITLATYGAFLLRNVLTATGISEIFGTFVKNGGVDTTLLLSIVPAALGILTASALGGVTTSVPILASIVAFSPQTASLIYMSAYLGYVVSPTHLCFAFTAEYFKCSLKKIYRYLIPSTAVTFAAALGIYFLL